jgi:hypothetical protein
MHHIVLLIMLGQTALIVPDQSWVPSRTAAISYHIVSAAAIYQCTKHDSILEPGLFTPGRKIRDN